MFKCNRLMRRKKTYFSESMHGILPDVFVDVNSFIGSHSTQGEWFSFIKCLLRLLFPLRRKEHNLKTRNENKYQVTHAHTERLKKSPIITMQNLLNENK